MRVQTSLRVPMRARVCLSARARARMCLGWQRKRVQAINVRRTHRVLRKGALRLRRAVLCETVTFKSWVEWRRLTTTVIASGVAPSLNHTTTIPLKTIAERAWCEGSKRAWPDPSWSINEATIQE